VTPRFIVCASAIVLSMATAIADVSTPTPAPATEKAVADRSVAFAKAAQRGDLDTFPTFMSDDYVMMWVEPAANGENTHWVAKTKREWIEELRSNKNRYRSIELHNTKVHLHGNVALFTGEYTQTGTREGKEYSEQGLFAETWVKRHGQWIIVSSVFP
jgi:ketosteroid isomerase-like protein